MVQGHLCRMGLLGPRCTGPGSFLQRANGLGNDRRGDWGPGVGGTGGLQEGTGNRTEVEGGLTGTSGHTTWLSAPRWRKKGPASHQERLTLTRCPVVSGSSDRCNQRKMEFLTLNVRPVPATPSTVQNEFIVFANSVIILRAAPLYYNILL